MRIAVVGLGKLGAPFAALLASKGHEVVGVDLDQRTVDAVNRGEAPVEETDLPALMALAGGRLSATTDAAAAARGADLVFTVVPTPSLADATFDVRAVEAAMSAIGAGIREDPARRRAVVVTSTVLPGATRGPIRRALEEASGVRVGDTLGLCYSPEFIALGSVVADLRRPDFILVGESAPWTGELVGDVLAGMTDEGVPVRRMTLEEAEVAKIAVNTFVTTKISYANMIAEICERIPGTDAGVVTAAVGSDSRIGPRYLSPGAPFGGPCFPRDNAALAALARSLGVTADIAEATDRINGRQASRLVAEILGTLGPGEVVGILGLAYKPATAVTVESFGLSLAAQLAGAGVPTLAYDPVATPAAEQLPAGVELARSLAACVGRAGVLVVATAWAEFELLAKLLETECRVRLVFDCWHLLDPAPRRQGLVVRRPGVGPQTVSPPEV